MFFRNLGSRLGEDGTDSKKFLWRVGISGAPNFFLSTSISNHMLLQDPNATIIERR